VCAGMCRSEKVQCLHVPKRKWAMVGLQGWTSGRWQNPRNSCSEAGDETQCTKILQWIVYIIAAG
jgi:hypothetical protein